jgi:enoyl-[acyl-carrier protein] reductase II
MLHTPLCDRLGISIPIVQAPIAPYTSPQLVAAVSNAGGLGSIGTALQSLDTVKRQVEQTQKLTSHPFAINFTNRTFNEELFSYVIREAKPKVISYALGNPGELVKRAHDAGILFIQQVHTTKQAQEAAELEADAIIAQGTEAGGFCGNVAALSLIPQVVDEVGQRTPVIAAGGIADGRGLAAALLLGAQGVNTGTRFLASTETAVNQDLKNKVVSVVSEDAIKAEFINIVFPSAGKDTYEEASPRALRTPFIEQWNGRSRNEIEKQAEELRDTLMEGMRQGRDHELVPFAGQSAGLVHEILPAAEIINRMVIEATEALERAVALLK